MRSVLMIFTLAAAVLAGTATPASAEQYAANGRVVHTRVAPVVVHRIFPPYRGVHVYQGRTVRR